MKASVRYSVRNVSRFRRHAPPVKRYIEFRTNRLAWSLATAFTALGAGQALANPTDGQVSSGSATITQNGKTLTVRNSPGTVINWQSFSIKAGETTNFIQQSVNSAVLNRVVGKDPSLILGNLTSNGKIFLVNPNGMVFGQGAMVDAAGLVVSTLNITDADFQSGKMRFVGNAGGTTAGGDIKVAGVLRSSSGDIYLIAPNIENTGAIKAVGGNAVLAAGEKVEILGPGLDDIKFTVQNKSNQAVNLGKIEGDAVGMFAGTLRQAGVVQANALAVSGGKVVLSALGNVTLAAGSTTSADGVAHGGTVNVSSATGNVVAESGSTVTANGAVGGDINVRAAQGDVTIASGANFSASGHQGGTITLRADAGTNTVSGMLAATGTMSLTGPGAATGGAIHVLGNQVAVIDQARLDASGDEGGGSVLVGGDWQGKNPDIQNSQSVYLGTDASLIADARVQGNGGKVVVYSDGDARVYGSISAIGGEEGGNGGDIETSGKQYLIVTRTPAFYSRRRGKGGSWLLDPTDIDIVNGTSGADIAHSGVTFGSDGSTTASTLDVSVLNAALAYGGYVTISTNSTAGGAGNIAVNAAILGTSGYGGTLNLLADNNININQNISYAALNLSGNIVTIAPTVTINTGGLNFSSYSAKFQGSGSVITGGGNIGITTTSTANDSIQYSGTLNSDGGVGSVNAGWITIVSAGGIQLGALSANGAAADFSSGGGGGTINISGAGNISLGTISASGGAGYSDVNGYDGGGGGAITVTTQGSSAMITLNGDITARGGNGGDASGESYGSSYFNAGRGGNGGTVTLNASGAGGMISAGNIDVRSGDGGAANGYNINNTSLIQVQAGNAGYQGAINLSAAGSLIAQSGATWSADGGNGGAGLQSGDPYVMNIGGAGSYGGQIRLQAAQISANAISAAGGSGGAGDLGGDAGGGGTLNLQGMTQASSLASFAAAGGQGGDARGNATQNVSGGVGGYGGTLYINSDADFTLGSVNVAGGAGGAAIGTNVFGTGSSYSVDGGRGGYGGNVTTSVNVNGTLTLAGDINASGGSGGSGPAVGDASVEVIGGQGGNGGQINLFGYSVASSAGILISAHGGAGGDGSSPNSGTGQVGGDGGGYGFIGVSAAYNLTLINAVLNIDGGAGGAALNNSSTVAAGRMGGNGGYTDKISLNAQNVNLTGVTLSGVGGAAGATSASGAYGVTPQTAAAGNGAEITIVGGQLVELVNSTVTVGGGAAAAGADYRNTSANASSGGAGGNAGTINISSPQTVTLIGSNLLADGANGGAGGNALYNVAGDGGAGGYGGNINVTGDGQLVIDATSLIRSRGGDGGVGGSMLFGDASTVSGAGGNGGDSGAIHIASTTSVDIVGTVASYGGNGGAGGGSGVSTITNAAAGGTSSYGTGLDGQSLNATLGSAGAGGNGGYAQPINISGGANQLSVDASAQIISQGGTGGAGGSLEVVAYSAGAGGIGLSGQSGGNGGNISVLVGSAGSGGAGGGAGGLQITATGPNTQLNGTMAVTAGNGGAGGSIVITTGNAGGGGAGSNTTAGYAGNGGHGGQINITTGSAGNGGTSGEAYGVQITALGNMTWNTGSLLTVNGGTGGAGGNLSVHSGLDGQGGAGGVGLSGASNGTTGAAGLGALYLGSAGSGGSGGQGNSINISAVGTLTLFENTIARSGASGGSGGTVNVTAGADGYGSAVIQAMGSGGSGGSAGPIYGDITITGDKINAYTNVVTSTGGRGGDGGAANGFQDGQGYVSNAGSGGNGGGGGQIAVNALSFDSDAIYAIDMTLTSSGGAGGAGGALTGNTAKASAGNGGQGGSYQSISLDAQNGGVILYNSTLTAQGGAGGAGGSVNLSAGSGADGVTDAFGNGSDGQSVSLTGGSAGNGGDGGYSNAISVVGYSDVAIYNGNQLIATGGVGGAGGDIFMTLGSAGNGGNGAAGATGAAGAAGQTGGNGANGGSAGSGGSLSLVAGNAGNGGQGGDTGAVTITSQNASVDFGGSIALTPGDGGRGGNIQIQVGNAGNGGTGGVGGDGGMGGAGAIGISGVNGGNGSDGAPGGDGGTGGRSGSGGDFYISIGSAGNGGTPGNLSYPGVQISANTDLTMESTSSLQVAGATGGAGGSINLSAGYKGLAGGYAPGGAAGAGGPGGIGISGGSTGATGPSGNAGYYNEASAYDGYGNITVGSAGSGGGSGNSGNGVTLSSQNGLANIFGNISISGASGGDGGALIFTAGRDGAGDGDIAAMGNGGNGGAAGYAGDLSINGYTGVIAAGTIVLAGGHGGNGGDATGYSDGEGVFSQPGNGANGNDSSFLYVHAGPNNNYYSFVINNSGLPTGPDATIDFSANLVSNGGKGGNGGAILGGYNTYGSESLTGGSGGYGGIAGALQLSAPGTITVSNSIYLRGGDGGDAQSGFYGSSGNWGQGGLTSSFTIHSENGDVLLNGGTIQVFHGSDGVSAYSEYSNGQINAPYQYISDSTISAGGAITQAAGSSIQYDYDSSAALYVAAGDSITLTSSSNQIRGIYGYSSYGDVNVESQYGFNVYGLNAYQGNVTLTVNDIYSQSEGITINGSIAAGNSLSLIANSLTNNGYNLTAGNLVSIQPYSSNVAMYVSPDYRYDIAVNGSGLPNGLLVSADILNYISAPNLKLGSVNTANLNLISLSGSTLDLGAYNSVGLAAQTIYQDSYTPLTVNALDIQSNNASLTAANRSSSGNPILLTGTGIGGSTATNPSLVFNTSAGTGIEIGTNYDLGGSGLSGYQLVTLNTDSLAITNTLHMLDGGQSVLRIVPLNNSATISIGGTGGFSLQGSDLNNVISDGTVVIGSENTVGQIRIDSDISASQLSGTLRLLNQQGGIVLNASLGVAGNLELIADGYDVLGSQFAANSGSIQQSNPYAVINTGGNFSARAADAIGASGAPIVLGNVNGVSFTTSQVDGDIYAASTGPIDQLGAGVIQTNPYTPQIVSLQTVTPGDAITVTGAFALDDYVTLHSAGNLVIAPGGSVTGATVYLHADGYIDNFNTNTAAVIATSASGPNTGPYSILLETGTPAFGSDASIGSSARDGGPITISKPDGSMVGLYSSGSNGNGNISVQLLSGSDMHLDEYTILNTSAIGNTYSFLSGPDTNLVVDPNTYNYGSNNVYLQGSDYVLVGNGTASQLNINANQISIDSYYGTVVDLAGNTLTTTGNLAVNSGGLTVQDATTAYLNGSVNVTGGFTVTDYSLAGVNGDLTVLGGFNIGTYSSVGLNGSSGNGTYSVDTLNMNGSSLSIGGTLTAGQMSWTAGSISGQNGVYGENSAPTDALVVNGNLNLGSSGLTQTVYLNNISLSQAGSGGSVAGNLTLQLGDSANFTNYGTINILGGSRLDVEGSTNESMYNAPGASINVSGYYYGEGDQIYGSDLYTGAPFRNDGTISVSDQGLVQIAGYGQTHAGDFIVDNSGSLYFSFGSGNGPQITTGSIRDGSNGSGSVQVNFGGSLDVRGDFSFSGDLTVSDNSSLTMEPTNGALYLNSLSVYGGSYANFYPQINVGGLSVFSSGSVNFYAPVSTSSLNISDSESSVSLYGGNLTVSDSASLYGGTIYGSPGNHLVLQGYSDYQGTNLSVDVDNSGSLNVNSSAFNLGYGQVLTNSGTLNFNYYAGVTFGNSGTTLVNTNSGSIYNNTGISEIAGTLSNAGAISVGGTSLLLSGAGTHSSTATVDVQSGSTLIIGGNSTFNPGSSITNQNGGGTVDVTGTLTLNGSYSMTNTQVDGGHIADNGELTTSSLVINNSGLVDGSGNLTVTDNLNYSGGALGSNFFNINITQSSGDLTLYTLGATNLVTVDVVEGQLLSGVAPSTANITAPTVYLSAYGNIDLVTAAGVLGANGGGDVTLVNQGDVYIAGLNAPGNLNFSAQGNVYQYFGLGNSVNVGGTSTLASSGNLYLDNPENIFTGPVSVNVQGAATLTANGALNVSGFVGSDFTTTAAATTFGATTVNGGLVVYAGGTVSQTDALTVSGTSQINAAGQTVALTDTSNSFGGTVNVTGATSTTLYSGSDLAVNLATSGLNTLNAAGHALTVSGTTTGSLNTSAAATNFGATIVGGNLTTVATGNVTQSGTLSVAGTSGINAGGNNIALSDGSNTFVGTVNLSGATTYLASGSNLNAVFTTSGPTTFSAAGKTLNLSGTTSSDLTTVAAATGFGTTNVGGNLAANASGAVTQTGALNVTGTGAINASGNTVTLNGTANHFGGTLNLTGTTTQVTSAGNLTAALSTTGPTTLKTGSNALTVSGSDTGNLNTSAGATTFGATTVGGNLVINASGTVSETAALSVSGTTTINASGQTIVLANSGNSFGGTVNVTGGATQLYSGSNLTAAFATTGPTTLSAVGKSLTASGTTSGNLTTSAAATSFGTTTVGGNLTSVATGAVTQTGALNVSGTSAFNASGNSITLTNGSNAFGATVSLTGAATQLVSGSNLAASFNTTGPTTLSAIGNNLSASGTTTGNLTTNAAATSFGFTSVGGNLLTNASGPVTQTGPLLVTGSGAINASGNSITLNSTGNDFGGTLSLTGGTTQITDSNALTVALFGTGSTTLNAGGALGVSGSTTGNLTTTTTSGGTTSFGPTSVAGNLLTTSSGAVGESGSLVVGGTANINAGSSSITLDGAGNDFVGALNLTGGTTRITDINGLTAGLSTGATTLNAGGTLNVSGTAAGLTTSSGSATTFGATTVSGNLASTSGAAVFQTGPLIVSGTGSINAGSNAITLNGSGNDFGGTLSLTGGTTQVTDTNALTVALSTGQTFLNASGALGVSGTALTLATTTTNSGTTNFGATTVAGNLLTTSAGAVTESGTLVVSGTSSINAGSNAITLNGSGNDFVGLVSVAGGTTQIADANSLSVSLATGATTLTAGGALNVSGGAASLTTTTTNGGTTTFGGVNVGGILFTTSSGAVTETGPLVVAGAASINALGNAITLNGSGNDFVGQLNLTGGTTQVTDINGLTAALSTGPTTLNAGGALVVSGTASALTTTTTQGGTTTFGSTTVAGNLATTSAGAVTETGSLQVAGTASINAGSNSIILNGGGNDFGGTLSVTGGTTKVSDINALTVALTTGATTLNAGGNLSVGGTASSLNTTSTGGGTTNFGATTVSGNLVTSSSGAVSETGPLLVGGATTIDAGLNAIALNGSGNDFTGTVSLTGGTASLADVNALSAVLATGATTLNAGGALNVSGTAASLATSSGGATSFGATTVLGNLASTSAGAVTETGPLVVSGTSSINAGSNAVALNGSGNDFVGTLSISGGTTQVSDINALTVALNTGATTLNASGALGISGTASSLTTIAAYHGTLPSTTTFGPTTVTGNLVTTSSGSVLETGPLVVSGTSSINAGLSSIVLNGSGNDFVGAVNLTGGTTRIADVNGLTVSLATGATTLNAGGTLSLSGTTGNLTTSSGGATNFGSTTVLGNLASASGGAVTETGPLVVSGASSINAGTNSIALNGSGNDFVGQLNLTGGTTQVTDINALTVALNTGSTTLTASGALGVSGAASNLTTSSGGTTTFGATTLSGNLAATSSGAVNGTGPLVVAGSSNINAGSNAIALNGNNDFGGLLSVTGGTTSISDINSLTVALATGATTLNAGGALTLSGTTTSGLTTTSGGATTFGATTVFGNLASTSSGNISETGPLDVAGTSSFNAGSSAITLANAGNSLSGTINLTGGTTQLVNLENSTINLATGATTLNTGGNALQVSGSAASLNTTAGATQFGTTNVSGALDVNASGNVTQTGALSVGGISTIAAGTNDITLTNGGNSFGGAVSLSGATTQLASGSDLVAILATTGPTTLNAGGNALTASGSSAGDLTTFAGATQFGTTFVGGNLAVNAGGAVSQTGSLAVAGTTAINASGQTIALNNTGNLFDGFVTLTGAATRLTSSEDLTAIFTTTGPTTLTATGQNLTASGSTSSDLTTNAGATTFGNTTVGNTLTVLASGAVSQTGNLSVAGATNIVAPDQSVLLTSSGNNFVGVVNVTGDTTQLVNSSALNVVLATGNTDIDVGGNTLTVSGGARNLNTSAGATSFGLTYVVQDLNVSASGAVSQTDALTVGGYTHIAAGTNSVTLNNAGNYFEAPVNISAGATQLSSSSDLDVTFVTSGDTALDAGTQSLSLAGITTGSLSTHAGATQIEGAFISNNLSVSASGPVSQTGPLSVGGSTLVDAGSNTITLAGSSNSFGGTVNLTGGATQLTSGTSLNAVLATGDTTLNAGSNALTVSGTAANLSTQGGSTTFGKTSVGQNLTVAATGAVNQTGTLSVAGTSTIAAGSNGIALTDAGNNFGGVLNVTGGSIAVDAGSALSAVFLASGNAAFDSGSNALSLSGSTPGQLSTHGGATTFGNTSVGGNLIASASGAVSQTGTLTVSGTTTVAAGSNTVSLGNSGNKLIGAVNVTGGATQISDSVALAAVFQTTGDTSLSAGSNALNASGSTTGSLTTSAGATQLNNVSVGNNLSVTASGPVTQSGVLNVGGTTAVHAGSSNVTLFNPANALTGAVSVDTTGNVALAASQLTLGNIQVGTGTLNFSGTNGITELSSGAIVQGAGAPGASFGTTSGSIVLNSSGNSFTGPVKAVAGGGNSQVVITQGTGDLSIATASGSGGVGLNVINGGLLGTTAGSVNITGSTVGITTQGGVNLTTAANTISLNTGGNASVSNTGNVNLAGLKIGGNLVLNNSGAISQAGGASNAVQVAGTSNISAGANAITLGNAANTFGGALTLTNSGSGNVVVSAANLLQLGNITTGTGTLALNGTQGLTQAAGTHISQASGAAGANLVSGSGNITLTNTGNQLNGPVQLAAGGNIGLEDANTLHLASAVAGGNITLHAPVVDVEGVVAGKVVSLAGDSGINVLANITSTQLLLNASAGDIVVGGGTAAPVLTSSGDINFSSGGSVSVLGSSGNGFVTSVEASGGLAINAAKNFTIQGGSGDSAAAQVVSVGNATITAGGTLLIQGGTGNGAYAVLDPTAQGTNLNVTAASFHIAGGSGTNAYALMRASGDINLTVTNDIVLTAGSGSGANAVLLAPNGTLTYTAASITGLNHLSADPFTTTSPTPVTGYLDITQASPVVSQQVTDVINQITQYFQEQAALVTTLQPLDGKQGTGKVVVEGGEDGCN